MSDPESQKPLQRGSVAARKFWQFGGFCGNFHQNSRCFVTKFSPSVKKLPQKLLPPCWKFPQKVAFMVNFHQKMPLWQISTKKLPLWKISSKLCLVGKFSLQQALLENFRKKLLC
jgi:hypothetical protein